MFEIVPCRICSIVTPARVLLCPPMLTCSVYPTQPLWISLYKNSSFFTHLKMGNWATAVNTCLFFYIRPSLWCFRTTSNMKFLSNSCNIRDLILQPKGRLRPCGFWLQRICYEFVKFVQGEGTGEVQWI